MDRAIPINADIIVSICDCLLDGNRNSLTARVQQLLFHCGDGVGIRAVNRREVSGQLAYGIVQLCFRCRHVGRVQRQDIFLGVGFARFRIGDRCSQRNLCTAACRQGDPAVTADERRIARVRDRVTRIRGRQGCFRTDDIIRRNNLVHRVNCSLGDVFRPQCVKRCSGVTEAGCSRVLRFVFIICRRAPREVRVGPLFKVIAIAGKGAFRQLFRYLGFANQLFHLAGAAVCIEADGNLIIAPLGNQRDLIQTAKIGILVHGFAERTITVFDVPAIQRLVCGIRITEQIRQLAEYLVRFYRFVRNGALIAVAVKMYCDALCPMRIQGNILFGVFRREFILVGDLFAALGCIEPAVEQIAGADGIINFSIIFVAANSAGACFRFFAFVIEVQRYVDLFALPCRIEIVSRTILIRQVFDRFAILNGAVRRTGRSAPAVEIITIAGKGILRKRNVLIVNNSIQRYIFANALAGVQHDGILNRRPLCGINNIAGDNGFRCQVILAVEPAPKGVAFFRRVRGHFCRTDGGVLRDINCCVTGFAIVVIKCHRIGVAPDRVEIEIGCNIFNGRAVGVDHCAIFSGRPTHKHLVGVGKSVRRQRTLTAVDVLGVVITRTAIGMESDNDRRAAGKIAQVYAVVVFITAAVLRILNHQPIAILSCAGVVSPITVAADGVGNGGAA